MDLIDRLRDISERIERTAAGLDTEEATKNALVMPFIQALGYDVFNPVEVIPEFTADVGTKKGEKVDYAIQRDGKPILLFECKCATANLDKAHASQLYRYFSVTDARFGILTNGIEYKVFSDLDQPNKMDERPFLEFDLRDIPKGLAENLKRFSKEAFDVDEILSTASEMKYKNGIKRLLSEEALNPSDDFVRLFVSRVYSGRITQLVKEQFTGITKRALQEFISDRVNERLKSALAGASGEEAAQADEAGSEEAEDTDGNSIITTEEEIEGFHIVKSILRQVADPKRIFMRDTRSYCGILFDDNNRKPICRMAFNASQKYLILFDASKEQSRVPINDLNDIYNHADGLKAVVEHYQK